MFGTIYTIDSIKQKDFEQELLIQLPQDGSEGLIYAVSGIDIKDGKYTFVLFSRVVDGKLETIFMGKYGEIAKTENT